MRKRAKLSELERQLTQCELDLDQAQQCQRAASHPTIVAGYQLLAAKVMADQKDLQSKHRSLMQQIKK
jgi:hypothetical protein